jgi:hypothetical protein
MHDEKDSAYFDDGTKRGQIRNQAYRNQEIDYSGCRINKCTPSDIDGIIEFENKLFIAFELKYGAATMGYGQKTMLERLAAGHTKPFYIFRVNHTTPVAQAIDVGKCLVTEYYNNKNKCWQKPKQDITVKDAMDKLYSKYVDSCL